MYITIKERYVAGMVLSGVGDALGYKNGAWEFCQSGMRIQEELTALGGLKNIHVAKPFWIVSDDTVMHLATADALIEWGTDTDKEQLYSLLPKHYNLGMDDMDRRAPGGTASSSCLSINPDIPFGYRIPFNDSATTCGAATRAMCIGLRYPRPGDLDDLIAVSVEAGRMTHHHPAGYLGSLATALFTAYSVQGKLINEWGRGLIDVLPLALEFVRSRDHCVEENDEAWDTFQNRWIKYLSKRNIIDGRSDPVFPAQYGVEERDTFYSSIDDGGWGGANGYDAPMIAYDALMNSKTWSDLCNSAMFHAGHSDSTGVIAACCYGIMYGFEHVPEKNHKDVEYRDRLVKAAEDLYHLRFPDEKNTET